MNLRLEPKHRDDDQPEPDAVEVDSDTFEGIVYLEVFDNEPDFSGGARSQDALVILTPKEARKIGKALIRAAKEAKRA